ncbi:hypothetical protein [Pseudomonas fulva]|uniref:hypothetical protein n=1 Tax=Pseudomonas fulva TaxID=47880 RepID=UPI002B1E13ED|nr:hypothetical protein [Pseudomonas fulva]
MGKTISTLIACMALLMASAAQAECYGEGEYMVCSDVDTDSDGDVHARSWDTQGNTYHLDTETRPYLNGHVVESTDSEGNSYSIKSWTDSSGSHTEDSEGNVCTITPAGQMIGCGQ